MKLTFWMGRVLFFLSFLLGTYATFVLLMPFHFFVIGLFSFSGYLLLEIVLRKYLQQRSLIKKREIALAELSSLWTNQETIQALKNELKELKELVKEAKKVSESPALKEYFGKIDEEKAEKMIDDPATIEKIVEKITPPQQPQPEDSPEHEEKEKSQVTTEDKKPEALSEEVKKLLELFPEKKDYINTVMVNLTLEKLKEVIKMYEAIKNLKPSLSCLIKALEEENECRIAYEAEKLRKKFNPEKFIQFVEELVNKEVNLEVDGKIYKHIAFSYKDCIYVNPILLEQYYPDPTVKEKVLAYLLKDYLCPSINWKAGFIRRGFAIKFPGGKEFRVPFIALKRSYFSSNFEDFVEISP